MAVKLLDEYPVFEDKLGVHKNIANSIVKIINDITSQGKDKKKNIIGLFGTWGVGKSTVINILTNNNFRTLASDSLDRKSTVKNILERENYKDFDVFIFDSWSHKDEFLKRAFLIKLANFLGLLDKSYKEVFENEVYNNVRKENLTVRHYLSNRIKEQFIENRKELKLTKPLYGVLLLLFLTVLGTNFLSLLKLYCNFIIWCSNRLIIDLALVELDLGVFTAVFMSLIGAFLIFDKTYTILEKRNIFSSVFAPFINAPLDVTESQLSAEKMDFSSYEFQKILIALLREKFKNDQVKKLIVVMDNLDRVNNETVLQFISLIQTALEAIENNDELSKRVVFIVPIDKTRLLDILRSISAEGKKDNFAEDFVEKIFPYFVIIPDLTLTNWKNFFIDKFKEAFQDIRIDAFDLELIMRLFQSGIKAVEEKITPREIIHFINQMVIHCIYWDQIMHQNDKKESRNNGDSGENKKQESKDRINLLNLAFFVTVERYYPSFFAKATSPFEFRNYVESNEEPIVQVIKPYLGSYIDLDLLMRDFFKFKFKTQNIDEIIYKGNLEEALVNGDSESTDFFYNAIQDKVVFSSLLKSIFGEIQESLKMDIRTLGNCAYALKNFFEHDQYNTFILNELKTAMINLTEEQNVKISTLDETSAKGISFLLNKNLLDDSGMKKIFIRIVNEMFSIEEDK